MVKRMKTRLTVCALLGTALLAGCGQTVSQAAGQAAAGAQETGQGQAAADEQESGQAVAGAQEIGQTSAGAQARENGQSGSGGQETRLAGSGTSIEVTGNGAKAEGTVVTITAPGTYRLSGDVEDGQVRIDAGKEDEIHLILDGFTITNSDSAAVYALQSGLVTITTEAGTENMVTDGSAYVFEKEGEDEPDAAIFSKDDLVLNGEGTLTVNGNYSDGIRSKDDLTVESGTYIIQAVNDGLKGKDSVTVTGGVFTITAGADGIQSSNDTDEGKGYIRVEDGDFTITAGKKGLLAAALIDIQGGSLLVEAEDDAVHSDGDVNISEGTLRLSTGDDAVHANQQVTVKGGTITISKSYEGIEGLSIDINGGDITLLSEDDGINAAGGSDSSGNAGNGRDNPFAAEEGAYIRITGGTLRISASGDGIDSNGDFFMEGGVVYVEGPVGDGDGTLDYNGTGTMTGGTFFGAGSSGMLQSFSESSAQPVIVVYYSEKQSEGTVVSLLDGSQDVLLEETPSKDFSSVIISTPEIKTGETYQVVTGESADEITIVGIVNESGTRPAQGGLDKGHMGGGPGGGNKAMGERPSGEDGGTGPRMRAPGEEDESQDGGGMKPPGGEAPSGKPVEGEEPS